MRRQGDGRLKCLSHVFKRADELFELRTILEHIARNGPHLSGMSHDFGGQLADSAQNFLVGGHFTMKFLKGGLCGIAFSQGGLKLLCEMSDVRLTVFQLSLEARHNLFTFPASILKVPNRLNPRRDRSRTESWRSG